MKETAVATDFTGKTALITGAGRASAAPSRSGWPPRSAASRSGRNGRQPAPSSTKPSWRPRMPALSPAIARL